MELIPYIVTPLPYEGRLTKLLCISRAIFEKLTLAARKLFIEPACPECLPAPAQENDPSSKEPVSYTTGNRNTGYLEYTPSRIWPTRNSKFWQWRRVSDWWRQYGQDEFINEKRHMLQ